ncbi:MAG: PaaI family thioesterase [Thermoanaerobaculia bacterium]
MTIYQQIIQSWLAGTSEGAPVATLIGMRIASFEDGVIRLELDVETRHHNPMGILHGGILCDLADLAMGTAMAATLAEGEGFTTVQLAANFLRSVKEGLLIATGKVVHRGRSTGYTECEIVDAQGRTVAKLTSTCMVTRPS